MVRDAGVDSSRKELYTVWFCGTNFPLSVDFSVIYQTSKLFWYDCLWRPFEHFVVKYMWCPFACDTIMVALPVRDAMRILSIDLQNFLEIDGSTSLPLWKSPQNSQSTFVYMTSAPCRPGPDYQLPDIAQLRNGKHCDIMQQFWQPITCVIYIQLRLLTLIVEVTIVCCVSVKKMSLIMTTHGGLST